MEQAETILDVALLKCQSVAATAMQLHAACCAEPAPAAAVVGLPPPRAPLCLPLLSRCSVIIAVGLQTARAGLAVGAGDSQPHGAVARRDVCSLALDLRPSVPGSAAQRELGLAAAGRPPAGRSLGPTAAGLPEGASTTIRYAADAWLPRAQLHTTDSSWRPTLPPLLCRLLTREPLCWLGLRHRSFSSSVVVLQTASAKCQLMLNSSDSSLPVLTIQYNQATPPLLQTPPANAMAEAQHKAHAPQR